MDIDKERLDLLHSQLNEQIKDMITYGFHVTDETGKRVDPQKVLDLDPEYQEWLTTLNITRADKPGG